MVRRNNAKKEEESNFMANNVNINATPSEVTVGSSIESPPGYPKNPAQAPNQDENVGRGIPRVPDYYSIGLTLMSPCHLCGRAFSETPGIGGPSIQEHIQSHNESPYMREGSDFGDNDYEV
jgi:hypothetical protein